MVRAPRGGQGRCLFQAVAPATRQHHLEAIAQQGQRGGAPDAAARTGHDGDPGWGAHNLPPEIGVATVGVVMGRILTKP